MTGETGERNRYVARESDVIMWLMLGGVDPCRVGRT